MKIASGWQLARTVGLVTVGVASVALDANAQTVPRLERTLGADDRITGAVRAIAVSNAAVAIVTPPDSAIHVFEPSRSAHFGREGDGPHDVGTRRDLGASQCERSVA